MSDSQTVCLVTRAQRGLGREIARQLASTGAFVYVTALDPGDAEAVEKELRAEGFDVAGIAMDIYEYAPYKTLAYSVSKAALNAATVLFANELRDTCIKINAADPGHCATDLNGYTGKRTAEQGAAIAVRLAMLLHDGPTGRFFDERGRVPW
jgi:NAD(P)-dependent dehydrogenase (short-subunit alcohol dehydrogenase family)